MKKLLLIASFMTTLCALLTIGNLVYYFKTPELQELNIVGAFISALSAVMWGTIWITERKS